MTTPVGIIMNGVTGRMGRNQHLIRSILAIREQGGLPIGDGEVVWPEPLLVGRSEDRLRALAQECGLERWSTDLQTSLADPDYPVYFDAQLTALRAPAISPSALPTGRRVGVATLLVLLAVPAAAAGGRGGPRP